jgi:aspartate aminotransferase-like enzyme
MREESGFVIAGGQGNLQGKIIRLGHIGNIDIFDTLGVLAALELVLLTEGMEFAIGTSVTAAMQDFSQHK